jgi:hypothetical protein
MTNGIDGIFNMINCIKALLVSACRLWIVACSIQQAPSNLLVGFDISSVYNSKTLTIVLLVPFYATIFELIHIVVVKVSRV